MAHAETLEKVIRFWESALFHHKFLMGVTTQLFVEETVKYLKELQEIKKKEGAEE